TSNPLTVIEQFTYLIFLKQLDDKQIAIDKEKQLLGSSKKKDIYTEQQKPLRWSYFKDLDPERMFDVFRNPQPDQDNLTAFDFMRTLGATGGKFSEYMKGRSEEHTSELQSRENLVCRLLLEKKNIF